MSKYAELNNMGIVKIHDSLPKSWKNISGFHALSDVELSNLSWSGNSGYRFYRYEEQEKPSTQDGFYNISGPSYEINDLNKIVYGSWSATPISSISAWEKILSKRTQLLYLCDWTQLPDAPLTVQQKADWTTYRQALRDITAQEDPFNITWPTEPAT